jgi:alanyl-tRNA synthetase
LELKIAALEASHIQPTDGNLVSYFEGMNVESLIAFSNVARQKVGGILVALGGVDGDFKYVISSDKYDVRSMSKDINSALNGRGGGNSGMIQGSFKASLDDIKAYFE